MIDLRLFWLWNVPLIFYFMDYVAFKDTSVQQQSFEPPFIIYEHLDLYFYAFMYQYRLTFITAGVIVYKLF